MGYIYLIKLANFVQEDKNIYKIGRTGEANMNNRLRNYDRNYKLFYSIYVEDPVKVERVILKKFNNEFKRYNEGDYKKTKEYFEGNKDIMINIINQVCCPKDKSELDKGDEVSWVWKLLGS